MTFLGMIRCKNEARWIERVIKSIQPLCERIFVLDDHSDDGTPDICESLGCTVYRSHFEGLDESRDKNWLLQQIWKVCPPLMAGPESQSFIVAIDGDEELESGGAEIIRRSFVAEVHALTMPIVYLWDSPDQIRTDGCYGKFSQNGRISAYRMVSPLHAYRRTSGKHNARQGREEVNFHCGNAPKELLSFGRPCPARLLHYGYMYREDRIRKYEWYREKDKDNEVEDYYRHVVIGDIFPANSKMRWGGPLKLEPLVKRVAA